MLLKVCWWRLPNFEKVALSLSGGNYVKAKMDQASGGEDPNKPSKKKSNEDEGKNKKLVGIQTGPLPLHGSSVQRTVTSCIATREG